VIENQVRTAAKWSGTSQDILAGNILREQEAARNTRLELVLLAFGLWGTQRSVLHDALVVRQRAAGAATPAEPGVPAR